ncbi:aspartic peptidase domain-containing protein [Xylogone sp. PMI_703]|nr:aspartic peptidase domain-containing protein [Xylogone sp. PMI_703]
MVSDSYAYWLPAEAIVSYYSYVTNFSVGTPPQSFRAVIDLDWNDLILPSSTCVSTIRHFCNPSNATYNANASSTYHPNGTITRVGYGPFFADAHLSEDVLIFTDGVQVPSQIFHEATHYTEWWTVEGFDIPFADSILGLSMGKEFQQGQWGLPNVLPSPLRNMVDQKVLEKNMFSIVFPSDEREQGSLTFGGYDEDLLDGELISHPMYPRNRTRWQLEVQSVSVKGSYNCGPEKILMHRNIPNTKGWLLSTEPFLGFSGPIASELYHYINGWNDGCATYPRVSCDELSSLPEIIIGLKGQNITLKGPDYVSKITVGDTPTCSIPHDDRDRCYVMIEWLGTGAADVAILGTPFLETVMGVWDWDTRTISFGNLKK